MYYTDPLPFAPTQIQTPFLNLTLNNPPYVPRCNVDPQMQQMVPLVAAATAIEIQNNSQKNSLRVFMYNQYSANAFANQDFDALVCAILDYMTLGLMKRVYVNPEQAAQQAIPEMVTMLCAVNVRIFPALEQYVDMQTMNITREAIQNFDMVAQEINRMKQQMGGGYVQQQQQQSSGFGFQQQVLARPAVSPSMGGSGLFSSNASMGAPVSSTGRSMAGAKYADDGKSTMQVKQPFVGRNEEMKTQEEIPSGPKVVLAATSGLKWRPTVKQPYYPAYNPVTQEMYYRVDGDKNITEVIIKERDIPIMDYDRHNISTVFGPIPKELSLSNEAVTLQNISKGIYGVNNATARLQEEDAVVDIPEITTFVKTKTIIETSLRSAWFSGATNRMKAPMGEIPDVYRVYAIIADPFVSNMDETDIVKDFASSGTYVKLCDKMNEVINDVSPELWNFSNRKMTDLVNRILKQNMSIPNFSIDSFAADIKSLVEYLNTKYGPTIQEAFLKNQSSYIEGIFQVLDSGVSEQISGYFIDGCEFEEGTEPKFTFMSTGYSLTYLNCLSHELEIELSNNTSSVITSENTPIMNKLLVGLFKDVEDRSSYISRHLIRTNDGRILEAVKGAIGIDFYLLTLIE